MVHLNLELCQKVLKVVKESRDCADVQSDLDRIQDAISNLYNEAGLLHAQCLDQELRRKYPIIDVLLYTARSFPTSAASSVSSNNSPEENALLQDHIGILSHVALKKDIVQHLRQMFKQD